MSLLTATTLIRGALRRASQGPVVPTNVTPPRLSGSIAVDRTVDFIAGEWVGPATTFTYQLLLDGEDVVGATGPTYTFLEADEGKVATLKEIPAIGEPAFSEPSNPVLPPIASATILYVGDAAGTQDGSTVANRGAFSDLNSFIGAPIVETVRVYSPEVINHPGIIHITNGGSVGDPITITGVDASGNPLLTPTDGARANPWTPGDSNGGDHLLLRAGADHLTFKYLDFNDAATGIRVIQPITGLTIEDCKFTNCQRGLNALVITGLGTSAAIDGLTIKNTVFAGFSKQAVHLQYGSTNFLLEDLDIDGENQDLDNYCIGVHLGHTTNTGIVRRVRASRGVDNIGPASREMQPDGFHLEVGTHDIEVDDCIAEGWADSGFDIAGTNHTLTDNRAYDCRYGFRCRSSVTLTRPKVFDSRNRGDNHGVAQIAVAAGATVTIVDGAFVAPSGSTVPTFFLAAGASLVLQGFSVQKGSSAPLVAGPGAANVTGLGTEVTPPVCTSIPTITGTKAPGNILSGSNGIWTGASTFGYQWLRNGLYIFSARSADYEVVAVDMDADISRRVFAFDVTGKWVGEATSVVIGAAVDTPPNFLTPPTISGLATVGSTLTATDGTVEGTPTPTVTRQWVRGPSTDIAGATLLQYDIQAADEGFTLKIRNDGVSSAGSDSIESAPTAVVTEPVEETGGFYVGPTAAGTADGSSFANRRGGGLAAIPGIVSGLGPGSIVKVLNDFGDYVWQQSPIPFNSHGGAVVDNKIKIMGWNGTADVAGTVNIRSSRTAWTLPAATLIDHAPPGPYGNTDVRSWNIGWQIFRLTTGASFLEFSGFHFERCGDGAFFFEGGPSGVSIHDCSFYNVKRFIQMSGSCFVRHSEFYNLTGIGYSECAIAVRGASHHITIGQPGTPGTFSCDFDSGRQDGDNFCMGICFDCAEVTGDVASASAPGSNMSLYRVRVKNSHEQVNEAPNSYWNGDGVLWGRPGNYPRAYMEDCVGIGCTDGGFDVQAGRPIWSAEDNPIFVRCINTGSKMNFRLSHVHMIDCESHNPVKRGGSGIVSHIQMSGRGTSLVEGGLISGPSRAVDTIHPESRVDCEGVEINGAGTLFSGPGTLTLDAACSGDSLPTFHDDFSVPTFIAFTHKSGTSLVGTNALRTSPLVPSHKVGDIMVALFCAATAGPATITPDWNYFGPEIVIGTFCARLAWRRLDLVYFQGQEFRAGVEAGRLAVLAVFDGCIVSGDPFEGYATTSGTGAVMTSPTTVVSGTGRMVCRAFLQKSVTARSGVPAGYTQVASRLSSGLGVYLDTKAGVGASTEVASVSNRSGTVPWASFGFALKPQ